LLLSKIGLSAALGFHELLRELVAHGVDLDRRDVRGYTALHYAALYGHSACERFLVEGGANLDIQDRWGRLAQELAEGFD
jgi:ankyrin repeat protein